MAVQIFKNPTGKGDIKLNECKLSNQFLIMNLELNGYLS